jgi:cytidine deaminase
MIDWQPLIEAALSARERAYAPYSKYQVGAALLGREGTVFTGANVENRIYGLTLCAERSALVAAVSAGVTRFDALVIATDSAPPAAPCGQCRDSLAEFAIELPILLINTSGEQSARELADLLPEPFRLGGKLPGDLL